MQNKIDSSFNVRNDYLYLSDISGGVGTMGTRGAQVPPNILTGGLDPVILNLGTC